MQKREPAFEKYKTLIYKGIEWLILGVMLCRTFYHLDSWLADNIDSDMASELMLANILSRDGGILSGAWYYSTELRVLHTQLVCAPLFHIWTSWHTVRLVSGILLVLILLISFFYLSSRLKIEHAPLFATLLICPLSYSQFYTFLAVNGYIPHVSISFFTLGLTFQAVREQKKGRYWLWTAILCVLALVAGMGGLRQLFVLYCPLFMGAVFLFLIENKNFFSDFKVLEGCNSLRLLKIAFLALVSAVIGYGVNLVILSKFYVYDIYGGQLYYRDFSLAGLEKFIAGVLENFGFHSDYILFSKSGILYNIMFALVVLLTVCALVRILPNRGRMIREWEYTVCAGCFIFGLLLFLCLFLFTSMGYEERYLVPVTIMYIPLLALFFKDIGHYRIRKYAMGALVVCALLVSELFYVNNRGNQWDYESHVYSAGEIKEIASILEDARYLNGYASFWNANVLTEFSDGDISVWDFGDTSEGLQLDHMYSWLQLRVHDRETPTGKVFVLLTREQDGNTSFIHRDKIPVLYQSDFYILYGFENYEKLRSHLGWE